MITPIVTGAALAVQGLSKEKQKITMVTGAATSDLTGKQCSPYGFHWAYDTHALAVGTGGALVENGGNKWFFLTADYAFGYSLESETSRFVNTFGRIAVAELFAPAGSNPLSALRGHLSGS